VDRRPAAGSAAGPGVSDRACSATSRPSAPVRHVAASAARWASTGGR
jgi:hypothetical protein